MLSKDFRFRLDFLKRLLTGDSDVDSLSALKLRFFVLILNKFFLAKRPFRWGVIYIKYLYKINILISFFILIF